MTQKTFNIFAFIFFGILTSTLLFSWLMHEYGAHLIPEVLYHEIDFNDEIENVETDTVYTSDCVELWARFYPEFRNNYLPPFDYHICFEDLQFSQDLRDDTWYLKATYMSLYENDKDEMDDFMDKITELISKSNLEKLEAARLIVNSVQGIPYTLIHFGSHKSAMERSKWMKGYHKQLKKEFGRELDKIGGCVEFVEQNGVMSPLEFLSHHKGDCDTRTLFLFTVLKNLNYDVVILNSNIHSHSILGINLYPGAFQDRHYEDNKSGTKYFVWETTVTGYDIGVFPDFNQNEWYIELI